MVSVTKKDEYNSLKCRSVSIELVEKAFEEATPILYKKSKVLGKRDSKRRRIVVSAKNGPQPLFMMAKKFKGDKLFKDFTLRWPDFVEFDELNSKIITKHSIEDSYRVWCLGSYTL